MIARVISIPILAPMNTVGRRSIHVRDSRLIKRNETRGIATSTYCVSADRDVAFDGTHENEEEDAWGEVGGLDGQLAAGEESESESESGRTDGKPPV